VMLKTAKVFGLTSFKQNSDFPIISTENKEQVDKFINENKGKKVIGTHSGCFHADEVLSCVMLKFADEWKDPILVRSRNPEIHKLVGVLVDVGGTYDSKNNRFDHHQKEFTAVFDEENKIKMSSAGLVYKHFGQEIIGNILKDWKLYDKNKDNLNLIYTRLYINFIMCVDALDNGINQYPDNIPPKYINTTGYGSRVGRLNPGWEEEGDQSTNFIQAMDVAEDEFLHQLNGIVKHFLPAYSTVKRSIQSRKEFHPSGNIFYLDKSCPWKEHLFAVEEELGIKDALKFVIYKDSNDGSYRVQTIPVSLGSFSFRLGIKQEWRGLNPEELVKVSGMNDIVFVHNSGFIGGARSLESAVKMCEKSLN